MRYSTTPWKRNLLRAAGVIVVLAAAIQLVPYGRGHAAPLDRVEPPWDSPGTRTLFLRTCGDCHSHQTRWPWYSQVAPMSWLVQNHVDEGREHFNVSAWGRGEQEADEAAEKLREGEMPLRSYLLLHREARLGSAERQALLRGLEATFGSEGEGEDAD